MAESLYFYKLVSEYPEDVTKSCKLSITEIDHDFKILKDYDIKSADFDRENKRLILTRNNGEILVADLSDVVYNLKATTEEGPSGITFTISYDGKDGPETVRLEDLITASNFKELIDGEVMTKVITDNTLKGDGTIDSPLGLNPAEQTGMYRPADTIIDTTKGEKIPDMAKLGTRYVSAEYLSEFGYLYNGDGVDVIRQMLADEGRGWRIPTKADWDALLNSIEPCEYRNHEEARCHTELGKVAGKYLKSACGWIGQDPCSCVKDAFEPDGQCDEFDVDIDEPGNMYDAAGVDKYGFNILPSGYVKKNSSNNPVSDDYGHKAYYWTDTHVCDDTTQDYYQKVFVHDKGGVVQEAECPDRFFSVRLVKDYDGSNFFGTENIGGVNYPTRLSNATKQIWTTANFFNTNGFTSRDADPVNYNFTEVNNGLVNTKRIAYYINEWNGEYWDRKLLVEGDTIVLNETVISGETKYNLEFRVGLDDNCNYYLYCTDDVITQNVLDQVLPILEQEKQERISGDTALQEMIEQEKQERISGDTALSGAIDTLSAETAEKIQELRDDLDEHIATADTKFDEIDEAISGLTEGLAEEIDRAKAAEQELDDKIEAEISARTEADEAINQRIDDVEGRLDNVEGKIIDASKDYTLKVTEGVVLESIDGLEEHFVKIAFDGNYGTFTKYGDE